MENEIYTCLWFDNQAAEVANYYCRIFPNSNILSANPMVVNFSLNGKRFMALNGGPLFKHSEAVSFVIECKDQEEIDFYWDALSKDGEEQRCGWLKDKYGISWQVIPSNLGALMSNPQKAPKVTAAFMKMKKFIIKDLE